MEDLNLDLHKSALRKFSDDFGLLARVQIFLVLTAASALRMPIAIFLW